MTSWRTLVVVPANTGIDTTSTARSADVIVVRNVPEEKYQIRGVSFSRVLLVGVQRADFDPALHDAYLLSTNRYMDTFGARPLLEEV